MTWAPMFEGVLMCQAKEVVPYYLAYREFQRLVEEGPYAESHTVRQRLKPGQCLVFNNRRMLHGREVWRGGGGGALPLRGVVFCVCLLFWRWRHYTCACISSPVNTTTMKHSLLYQGERGRKGWGGVGD